MGSDEAVRIGSGAAKRLAYYKAAAAPEVLAPRGWHCIAASGSGGTALYVTPEAISGPQGGITGPIVEVDNISPENGSGRSEIAEVIARIFPGQRKFVRDVIREFDLPPSNYKFGPFPNDKLILQTDRVVRFRTPPHSEGLSTMNWVKPNADPIDGVAILQGSAPDLLMLNVRLPRQLRDLAPVIIHDLLLRQRSDAR